MSDVRPLDVPARERLRQMLDASVEAVDANLFTRRATDYARAVGHACAVFTWLGIMLRHPSDNPQRDLDEMRRYLSAELPLFDALADNDVNPVSKWLRGAGVDAHFGLPLSEDADA